MSTLTFSHSLAQLAADRDRYLEKHTFPYVAKQTEKYEKIAKIGQVTRKHVKSLFSAAQ